MTPEQIEEQLAASRAMISELSSMTTHPEFVKIVLEIENAPPGEREEVARRLATLKELTSRGIPVPDQARISLRTFEDPAAAIRKQKHIGALQPQGSDWIIKTPDIPDDQPPTVCGSFGFFICLTVGDIVGGEADDDGTTGGTDDGTTGGTTGGTG